MYLSAETARRTVQKAMRCPYCVEDHGFLAMTWEPDGRFVCVRCAHTERPGKADIACTCRKCVRAFRFSHEHRPKARVAG
jgi:hypothetical protein